MSRLWPALAGGARRSRCRDPDQAGLVPSNVEGFTLIEVVVAVLVSAVMVAGFMGVALSSRMQTGRADHKMAATQHADRVLQKLKNFVSDSGVYGSGWLVLPGAGAHPDERPPGDCSGSVSAWALAPGVHDVSCLLTQDPSFAGLANVWMKYCVDDAGGAPQSCAGMTDSSGATISLACPSAWGSTPYKCVRIAANWMERGV